MLVKMGRDHNEGGRKGRKIFRSNQIRSNRIKASLGRNRLKGEKRCVLVCTPVCICVVIQGVSDMII